MSTESAFFSWTFVRNIPIPKDVSALLIPGESPMAAYSTIRDYALFTNYRLIIRDIQGVTGQKAEMFSLPWANITMWSSQNVGNSDFIAEIRLWSVAGLVQLNLKRTINLRKIEWLIANCIFKNGTFGNASQAQEETQKREVSQTKPTPNMISDNQNMNSAAPVNTDQYNNQQNQPYQDLRISSNNSNNSTNPNSMNNVRNANQGMRNNNRAPQQLPSYRDQGVNNQDSYYPNHSDDYDSYEPAYPDNSYQQNNMYRPNDTSNMNNDYSDDYNDYDDYVSEDDYYQEPANVPQRRPQRTRNNNMQRNRTNNNRNQMRRKR